VKSLADFVREALARVDEIDAEEALRLLSVEGREGWHFVDVREPDEYAAGHIPGSRNYPRGFLEVRADLEHPKRDAWLADRRRPLLLYCGGGNRSALAAQTLLDMGFHRVVSLRGGFHEWTRRGHPTQT
jgi:rhodanese-related sulfurtransferase